jgi:hypothetical protein
MQAQAAESSGYAGRSAAVFGGRVSNSLFLTNSFEKGLYIGRGGL